MGCDIHLYAEKKVYSYADKDKIAGKWVSLDKWVERDEWETDTELYRELDVPDEDEVYSHGRNYNLFTALANVRSQYFTDPQFICEAKGFPKDASRMVKLKKKHYGSDGHSHSWLTLAELKAFDWSSFGKTCDDFRNEVFQKLEAWKKDYPHQKDEEARTDEEVRIVFWFDN